jgi:hypothetical protein
VLAKEPAKIANRAEKSMPKNPVRSLLLAAGLLF